MSSGIGDNTTKPKKQSRRKRMSLWLNEQHKKSKDPSYLNTALPISLQLILLLIFIEGTERRGKTAGSTKEKIDEQRR